MPLSKDDGVDGIVGFIGKEEGTHDKPAAELRRLSS